MCWQVYSRKKEDIIQGDRLSPRRARSPLALEVCLPFTPE